MDSKTEKVWKPKLPEYDDFEPRSEADAKAEWDEWMKQAIMDDKAQQEGAVRFEFDIEPVEQALAERNGLGGCQGSIGQR